MVARMQVGLVASQEEQLQAVRLGTEGVQEACITEEAHIMEAVVGHAVVTMLVGREEVLVVGPVTTQQAF